MSVSTYRIAVDWLFQQFPAYQNLGAGAYKPDLSNIQYLLDVLQIDCTQLSYVHVAGTNGKGSTCSMIASTLFESGYKVGLFTSPHIFDFRERIKINGEMISEDEVINFVNHLNQMRLDVAPSFFEITFALALNYFNHADCDIVVIETGLGGRLDATNVITPILSVITNIGLEHQQFLGDTRAKIAAEKAGIIKKNVPVIFGQFDTEIAPVFKRKSEECHSEMTVVHSTSANYLDRNKELAHASLEKMRDFGFVWNESNFLNGCVNVKRNTGLRARLELISTDPLILVDAAHNPDGVRALFDYVNTTYPFYGIHVVYGSSSDKDLSEIGVLLPKYARYYFTKFSNYRSMKSSDLVSFREQHELLGAIYDSPDLALNAAKSAVNEKEIILVMGSFYLLDEIF